MTLSSEAEPSVDPAGLPADPISYRKRGAAPRAWLIGVGVVGWTAASIWAGAWLSARLAPSAISPGETVAPLNIPFVTRPPDAEPVAVAAAPAARMVSADAQALAARVERLEAEQRRSGAAAAAALAAAVLFDAADRSAPFDAELAAVSHLLPPAADLSVLQQLAREGAPTRAALAAEFARSAGRIATAARTPEEGTDLVARLRHALGGVVTVRRVAATSGTGVDATLNRAQQALEDGGLEAAVAELDRLPAAAQPALRGWRERAQRRLVIDGHIAALRTAAMRDLAQSTAARP